MSSKAKNRAESQSQVRHFTQRELAKCWNKSEATIERYRALGNSPRFFKIGGKALFREEDLLDLRAQSPVRNQCEPGTGSDGMTDLVIHTHDLPDPTVAQIANLSPVQILAVVVCCRES